MLNFNSYSYFIIIKCFFWIILNTSLNKIVLMNYKVLDGLEKRNNILKSKLLHQQLKCGQIPSYYYEKYSLNVIHEYKLSKSLIKSAFCIRINPKTVMDWYVQGQLNNPYFRGFYLAIERINQENNIEFDDDASQESLIMDKEEFNGDYVISEYGDGWSYKTWVGDEKVFIISDDLETLKRKIKDKHLPLD